MKITKTSVDACSKVVKGWRVVEITKDGELFTKFAVRYGGSIETIVFMFHNEKLEPIDRTLITSPGVKAPLYAKFQKSWLRQQTAYYSRQLNKKDYTAAQITSLNNFNAGKITTEEKNRYDLIFYEKNDDEIFTELAKYYDQDAGTFKAFFEELIYLNKTGITARWQRLGCSSTKLLFDAGGKTLFLTESSGCCPLEEHCLKQGLFFELKDMNFEKFKSMLRNVFDFCNLEYSPNNKTQNILWEISSIVCFTEAFLEEKKTDEIRLFTDHDEGIVIDYYCDDDGDDGSGDNDWLNTY